MDAIGAPAQRQMFLTASIINDTYSTIKSGRISFIMRPLFVIQRKISRIDNNNAKRFIRYCMNKLSSRYRHTYNYYFLSHTKFYAIANMPSYL